MRIVNGWRARTVSKSSSRESTRRTVRRAFIASSTTTGWTCASILLPKPAPTRGVRQRSRVIGRPSDSQTLACTRNTDWFADHSVIRPPASISASAPTGSSERCAWAWVWKVDSTTASHSLQAASTSPLVKTVREQRLPSVPASKTLT